MEAIEAAMNEILQGNSEARSLLERPPTILSLEYEKKNKNSNSGGKTFYLSEEQKQMLTSIFQDMETVTFFFSFFTFASLAFSLQRFSFLLCIFLFLYQ